MKLYQFRQCEVEFALTGEGIEQDETLSCPVCLASIEEPVDGRDDDKEPEEGGIDWDLVARFFRGEDDDS